MSARYRHRRTSTAATAFPTPVEPGEIVANTANRQLVIGDAASATLGAPLPLLAVRFFDVRAQYATGDFVVNAGTLYRANTPISPNPFNPAQWDTISSADVSKAYVDAGDAAVTAAFQSADANYLLKTGGTMSGALTLAADPATNLQASTKQYVDGKIASIPTPSSLTVSDTPPTGVPDGALWWESDSGLLYVKYNDGNTTQWVIACPQPDISSYALKTDVAPAIAASAVRYDAAQSLTTPQREQARQNIYAAPFDAMAYSGMQVNGAMEVSQEFGVGVGVTTSNKYVCDGWIYNFSTTGTGPANVFNSGLPGIPFGIVAKTTTPQATITGMQAHSFYQPIEGYRCARLAWGTASAQLITIGFWTAHTRIGIYSVSVRNNGDSRSYATTYTQNVSDAWEYKTITIPGDTSGTWATDNTVGMRIQFVNACGPTYTAPTANVWTAGTYVAAPGQVNGVAATTDNFRITGVTVLPGNEAPSAARSPFIMRPFDQELVTCQRYWRKSYPYASPAGTLAAGGALSLVLFGTTGTGNLAGMTEHFVVSMRAAPTITAYSQRTGASGMISDDYAAADTPATINLISEKRFRWYGATIAPNLVNFTMHFVADARL